MDKKRTNPTMKFDAPADNPESAAGAAMKPRASSQVRKNNKQQKKK